MNDVKYRIYPSLLDKFQNFLDSDIDAESFWNIDSVTGEPKLSADEIAAQREQELIDAINRKPHGPIEAADKGTCFNEIVDCIIAGRRTEREDMEIESVTNVDGSRHILARLNGFEFRFDRQLCVDAARYFAGSVPQVLCRAEIGTRYGKVELYGYADEVCRDKVYDIKTTSSYQFGKFERAWQKHVYPYCLVESGELQDVQEFEYTVFQLSKPSARNPVISGKMYKEAYTYDHATSSALLREILGRFIEWLEYNRVDITDRKIFNEDVSD